MAKTQQNLFVDPPTASSSDDDETQISESAEEDSSSDEEPTKSLVTIPSTAVTKAASGKSTVVSAGKQSSDSDSGTEIETDSEPEATDPPKSGSSEAVSDGKLSKKDSTVTVALPAEKSATKRPASEVPDNILTKRAKVVTSREEEGIKKSAFQRLWTEEDEVSVLQGLIDYKADTGKSPFEDKNGFYEFLKKSITFEVTKNQFMEKIRSLKKKFMGKNCKNGAEPKFSNAHDQKTYNLSKRIWGPDGIALESTIKSVGVAKKSQNKELDSVKQDLVFVASANAKKVEDNDKDWFENSFIVRSIAGFGIDERFVKEKWSLVLVEEKKKIEEKLKQLQGSEFEFALQKIGFVHDVASMIVQASKNNP